jgi:uncharacterized OB-fold protein
MGYKLYSIQRKGGRTRGTRCNLCQQTYRPRSTYERFCKNCRRDEELLRFYEWLQVAGAGVCGTD